MELIASRFIGPNQPGDFRWMLESPDYADAFFIFNDNESQYLEHLRHTQGAQSCLPGGGNAAIRPWQCRTPARAAGLPTGDQGGYEYLDDHVREIITQAAARAMAQAARVGAQRVFYSGSSDPELIGTGIFEVAPDVRRFAVSALRSALPD